MRSALSSSGKMILFLILGLSLVAAQVPLGLPGSPEFGFGARLDIWGQQVNPAINAASGMGLNWIAVDFDWGRLWPEANTLPDLSHLQQVMDAAQRGYLSVLLSITNAPPWALSTHGPDPELTAGLILSLYRLFPNTLLAVELFPGANQASGWGKQPDPAAYVSMLKITHSVLKDSGAEILIVAGGFTPLRSTKDGAGIEDKYFLESLYELGAAAYMPVIGLRLADITGSPLATPGKEDPVTLRHFEEIRGIMLKNQHQNGLIWITGFSWPADIKQVGNRDTSIFDEQAVWLSQAFRMVRSHLYIGAAFFDQLNPGAVSERRPHTVSAINGSSNNLILPDESLHPACNVISQLAAVNASSNTVTFSGSISKKTPLKIELKPSGP